MKKVLFATTALVASTGFAAAEVSLSGSAEMGIVGGDAYISVTDELQFHSDIDVKFSLSGETDNGLSFGATIDLDEVGDDICDTDASGDADAGDSINAIPNGTCPTEEHSVFISGAFGTLTMGDTDGAFDWAMSEVALAGGTIADDETAHAGYNGNAGLDGQNDGQILRYDYSFGDFGFAASVELDDAGDDDVYGVGVTYGTSMNGVSLGFGAGFQQDDTFNIYGVSVNAAFDNGFSLGANYSDLDGLGGNDSHWGIGGAYTMDALTFAANYGSYDTGAGNDTGWGVLVNYDLGGGAVIQGGYGSGEGTESYSLGVAMSF